jgi:hypothetical protein
LPLYETLQTPAADADILESLSLDGSMENTANNTEKNGVDRLDPSGQKAEQQDSTTTEANGGTRSSPPRVGGDGRGEAKDVKAKSAERAQPSPDEGATADSNA